MSNSKTHSDTGAQVPQVVLLDCGQATEVTKGSLIHFILELSWPPANKLLLLF